MSQSLKVCLYISLFSMTVVNLVMHFSLNYLLVLFFVIGVSFVGFLYDYNEKVRAV